MVPGTKSLYKFNSKAEDCVHCGILLNIFSNHINPIYFIRTRRNISLGLLSRTNLSL